MPIVLQTETYYVGGDKVVITPVSPNYGKYKSIHCYVDFQGGRYKTHSKGEAKRLVELLQHQAARLISHLQTQVRITLEANGQQVCDYIADFRYIKNGIEITEDYKSDETARDDTFRMKQAIYNSMFPENLLRIVTQANPV